MENNTILATLSLSLEEVDVVLNALEEKSINIEKLRQSIYNTVKAQIPQQPTEPQEIVLDRKKGHKKKHGKQNNHM